MMNKNEREFAQSTRGDFTAKGKYTAIRACGTVNTYLKVVNGNINNIDIYKNSEVKNNSYGNRDN